MALGYPSYSEAALTVLEDWHRRKASVTETLVALQIMAVSCHVAPMLNDRVIQVLRETADNLGGVHMACADQYKIVSHVYQALVEVTGGRTWAKRAVDLAYGYPEWEKEHLWGYSRITGNSVVDHYQRCLGDLTIRGQKLHDVNLWMRDWAGNHWKI